jgi:hypothetical protein
MERKSVIKSTRKIKSANERSGKVINPNHTNVGVAQSIALPFTGHGNRCDPPIWSQ